MKINELSSKSGFTIIELVVVIVIIGILATLTVVGWSNWRSGLAQKTVKSDLTAAAAAMENAKNFGSGYPTSIPASFKPGNDVTITYQSGNAQSYCIDGVSKIIPTVTYFINSATGTDPVAGTCIGGPAMDPSLTVVAYDTTQPGCSGTVQLPVNDASSPSPALGGKINWGDGTSGTLQTMAPSHTYATPGQYVVTYDGLVPEFDTNATSSANQPCLTEVRQWGSSAAPTKLSFLGSKNLVKVAKPPATVTDMGYAFYNCSSFNQSIDTWDTSNVTQMAYMFFGASSFNQPLNSWNTSKVTDMDNMFRGATAFNQPIGSWNTSSVTDMSYMFLNAQVFNQPIGSWNTSNVTTMTYMFEMAYAFNQPLGSWNTSKVNDMGMMFYLAKAFNQPIGSWSTSQVTNMQYMFYNANAFNQPLGSWNTGKVTNMTSMFQGATVFNQNISGWNVAAVTAHTSFRTGSALTSTNAPPGW